MFLDTSNEDVPIPPPQLPESARIDLTVMANWLLDKGCDEYLREFGKIRGSILQKSMNMLRNHQRSVSGGSGGASGSPMLVCMAKIKNLCCESRVSYIIINDLCIGLLVANLIYLLVY